MKIIKKCEKIFFEKILTGEKNFEVRLGDLKVENGDLLILKEVNEGKETGRSIEKKVGFVVKINDLPYWSTEEKNKHGFTIIQLEN